MSYPPQDPYGQQPPSGGWPAQQPGYQQPGYPPAGPPTQQFPGAYPDPGYPGGGYPGDEPPKKKTGMIIGIVLAVVVVLAAVGVTGFWKPGFFLASDDDKKPEGGGNPPGSSAPQVPGGSNPPLPSSPGGQPPKPSIQPPGGSTGPVPGGEGGDAASILTVAQETVDAFNARDKEALAATFCDPSSLGDFDMTGMPADAKMTIVGEPKITGTKAGVPVELSMGTQKQNDDMPLENQSGRWCVTND